MTSAATYYGFVAHRRRRAIFLKARGATPLGLLRLSFRPCERPRSGSVVCEVARACAALGGLALWIALIVLVG